MNFITVESYDKLSQRAASLIAAQVLMKPNCVLGLATGSSPIGIYKKLIEWNRAGDLDFSKTVSVNLDEYIGLDGTNDQSYRYFMQTQLFDHVNILPENTYVPNGCAADLAKECEDYDARIERLGGIDLQLLGIGVDGHIGFNEPGTPWESVTHVVELHPSTREVNARFFRSIDEVPTHAVTMGIKTVMNARSIILMAIGKSKAEIVKAMLQGPVTTEVPASILQLHPFVEVYLDEEAAALL